MHNYKQLTVWQNAVELSVLVYQITKEFPAEEKFGLVSQIRRAAVSVASNIAEGAGRNSDGEFVQFLGIATGSLNELETQVIIANKLGFISENIVNTATQKIFEVQNKIHKLKTSLKQSKS